MKLVDVNSVHGVFTIGLRTIGATSAVEVVGRFDVVAAHVCCFVADLLLTLRLGYEVSRYP
jgi:hypothetical protein